jgi:hypothetical protein
LECDWGGLVERTLQNFMNKERIKLMMLKEAMKAEI